MRSASLAALLAAVVALSVLGGCGGGSDKQEPYQPRVITTSSGLQYQDFKTGYGQYPEPGRTVAVNYTVWLSDGKKLDSNLDTGTPFVFGIGQGKVIKGFEEGIMSMGMGGQRRLVIPPELGYGEEGSPEAGVPPNATLVYFVEFLEMRQQATSPTGLKYEEISQGTGEYVEDGDRVLVDYTGWLTDGGVFDSSLDEGRTPFDFVIGRGEVIKGWDEGIKGMQVGGKRKLVVPPDLGYGEDGSQSGTIPPNATLIFECELKSIVQPETP